MSEIKDLAKNPCPICDAVEAGKLTEIPENFRSDPLVSPFLLEIGGLFYTKGSLRDDYKKIRT